MDEPSTFEKLHTAILGMQSGEVSGGNGISAELSKFGGVSLVNYLHKLIVEIWDVQKLFKTGTMLA